MKTISNGAKTVLKIVLIILIVIAMALIIRNLFSSSNVLQAHLANILILLALASALIYCLFGFQKIDSGFYKLFITVYGLSILCSIYNETVLQKPIISICWALIFGAVCVLGIAKDLGKIKSICASVVAFAASIFPLVGSIVSGVRIEIVFLRIICILMTVILNLMVLAKYTDKAERGTD